MRFNVSFNESNMRLDAKFSQSSQNFRAIFANLQKMTEYNDVPPYIGSYVVTPRVDEQVLPTAQKMMAEDLTIKEIPFFNVSNNSGGSTVYIGKEIET